MPFAFPLDIGIENQVIISNKMEQENRKKGKIE